MLAAVQRRPWGIRGDLQGTGRGNGGRGLEWKGVKHALEWAFDSGALTLGLEHLCCGGILLCCRMLWPWAFTY